MLVGGNKVDDVGNQLIIALGAELVAHLMGVLLYGPQRPQGHIGLLHLFDESGLLLAFHELPQLTDGRLHGILEIVHLVDAQRQAWQREEGVAGAALEPRITGQQIALTVLVVDMELVGGIDQAVEKIVARRALTLFLLEEGLQRAGLRRGCGSGKDNALTFLYWEREIAGYIEVFV